MQKTYSAVSWWAVSGQHMARQKAATDLRPPLAETLARPAGSTRKVDVRLPGKVNPNSHGTRPVHLIITMIQWIRTSRLSIKNSLSLQAAARGEAGELRAAAGSHPPQGRADAALLHRRRTLNVSGRCRSGSGEEGTQPFVHVPCTKC